MNWSCWSKLLCKYLFWAFGCGSLGDGWLMSWALAFFALLPPMFRRETLCSRSPSFDVPLAESAPYLLWKDPGQISYPKTKGPHICIDRAWGDKINMAKRMITGCEKELGQRKWDIIEWEGRKLLKSSARTFNVQSKMIPPLLLPSLPPINYLKCT